MSRWGFRQQPDQLPANWPTHRFHQFHAGIPSDDRNSFINRMVQLLPRRLTSRRCFCGIMQISQVQHILLSRILPAYISMASLLDIDGGVFLGYDRLSNRNFVRSSFTLSASTRTPRIGMISQFYFQTGRGGSLLQCCGVRVTVGDLFSRQGGQSSLCALSLSFYPIATTWVQFYGCLGGCHGLYVARDAKESRFVSHIMWLIHRLVASNIYHHEESEYGAT